MTPVDRSAPPAPGPIRPFDFPPVEALEGPAGLPIRLVRLSRLPVATAYLVIDAGEGALPPERGGLAMLAGDALQGGTRHRPGAELAEAVEALGADLSVHVGWDSAVVSVSALAERLPEAFALLGEMLLEPAFPADEVERIRTQRLATIRQRAMSPSSLAADAFVRFAYAEGSSYARPQHGTAASVAGVDREAVAAYAATHHRPGRGGLVVAGDVDAREMAALAGDVLGDWSGTPPEPAPPDDRPRWRERRVVVVARPGAVQSEIRIGHVGEPRVCDHFFALRVFNTVLGGAFTSRLNLNLRERHGFTYGVRSRFSFRRHRGPWTVGTAVETAVTADAVREAMSEIERLVADGPTDDEVEAARDYIAGVFPLRLETTGQLAARVAEVLIYGLPDDYHATYR
ncbi:MAG: insulinase family protein, partial [Gemmatimonadetes bacterium]